MADDLSLLFNIGIITGGTKRRNIKIFGASQGTAKAADVVTPSIPMELQCTKVRENYLARGEHNLPIMIINSLLQHELHVYPSSVRNSNIDSFFSITAKLLGKTICLRCPHVYILTATVAVSSSNSVNFVSGR